MIWMFVLGWVVGYISFAAILSVGISYMSEEQEEMKDIQTESDLFNYRNKK